MKKLLLLFIIMPSLNVSSQIIDALEIELNLIGDSNPMNITKGNTKIYFSANDGTNGRELWVYDYTTNNTHLVKDINSGSGNGIENSLFFTIDDILYFTPNYYNYGTELWRSDGTENGTYIVKHINNSSFNSINNLTNFNGNLVFSASDDLNGNEIWISDGTTNGTTILKDINIGLSSSSPNNFFVFNGSLFFLANDGINGNEIWKSDGTANGTAILKNINNNGNNSVQGGNFIILNNYFYFYANNGIIGSELWKSDGTSTGTEIFMDINVGVNSSNYSLFGEKTNSFFVFEVNSQTIGTELWRSDGTIQGTYLLKDINPSGNSVSQYTQFQSFNDKIYFDAYTNSNGNELWSTDGSMNGTLLVKDINLGSTGSNISKLTATSNFLIFSAKDETSNYNTLWKSNGISSGTTEIKDIDMSQFSNTELKFVEFNNTIFFSGGNNSSNGIELWTTDGSTYNTILFKDFFHKYSSLSNFYDSAELNDKLIFIGNDGNGNEPFISDGTTDGSYMIKDINIGNYNSLWSSDDFRPACFTKSGNYVFFRANNGTNGYEIWKTDGTEANTTMVKDIASGSSSSITEFPLFIDYNGIFYFKANDGIHGEELWRSDGTETGTYLIKDINPGSASGFIQSNIYYNHYNTLNHKCFAVLNGYLYFTAYDGLDRSIWRTDGTNNGTVKVITIPPSGVNDTSPTLINVANNKFFFKTNSNNSSYGNNTLWSSDGTQGGTINLGAWYNTAIQFKKNIVHNNELYFTVNSNDTGRTLMKSDGSISGTTIVKENFTAQQTFNSLYSCGNSVYFTVGQTGYTGKELWKSDGTPIGTIKLGDLTNSNLQNFFDCTTCYENNLIFRKDYFDNKLWYVNDNSIDANSFLIVNLLNAENFSEYEGLGYTITGNNGLFFTGSKQSSGNELYFSNFNFTLDNPNFEITIKENIYLYPNPTINNVYIKNIKNEIILNIKVYDILGKEISSLNTQDNMIELSSNEDGIYFIKIFTDKSTYFKKIILKK